MENTLSKPDEDKNLKDEEFFGLINQLTIQKFYIPIKLNVGNFDLEIETLFVTGADSNCIQEGLIPTKYFEKTYERLSTASGSKLQPEVQQKIKVLLEQIQNTICSDLPNAFWQRKKHIVDLPYEKDFNERQIPTKARPIQMSGELLAFCQKEIADLLAKGLIRKSKSPWSCSAFYVNKQSEIERGTPRAIEFADKFPNQIIDKTQLQRFLGCLNYIADFFPQLNNLIKPLHNRLKKDPPPWTDVHTDVVKQVKAKVKELPCLYLPNPQAFKIVETDASDISYGGILKQRVSDKEHIIAYTSKHWNSAQQKYSTVKKEVLAIVLCISKF
ncbi:uncharacterized protein LOC133315201 [Gastrolobium bilobum]|uniref:uncharacterized protein LOC133315201 n=1 Tax=Gastrolobium bilobum TaxID=150636 RepID=UPI002AB018B2|nr:uncharacterized protein LOC133315201 [Gastrolobium bilobum]